MGLFDFLKKKEEKTPACCCGENTEVKAEEPCCCGETAEKVTEEPSCCCGTPEKEGAPACCCGENASAKSEPCCQSAADGVCCVKVLGSGCKSCHALLENAQAAVKNLGLDVEVEYVTDLEKIMGYGVMSMPGLVINEQVVSVGKVLRPAEVEKLLKKVAER